MQRKKMWKIFVNEIQKLKIEPSWKLPALLAAPLLAITQLHPLRFLEVFVISVTYE